MRLVARRERFSVRPGITPIALARQPGTVQLRYSRSEVRARTRRSTFAVERS